MPDDVEKASRLFWDQIRLNEPDTPTYEEYIRRCYKRGGAPLWRDMVPQYHADDEESFLEYGADADLIRRVSAVARAVLYPPVENE